MALDMSICARPTRDVQVCKHGQGKAYVRPVFLIAFKGFVRSHATTSSADTSTRR
ncbi:hypothetical protein PISMIDRAFT_687966 [Pisolithus microcarpus 441]|uniref:Uncharacterized protein n=1 Tax=Pisolithus microcarpus 441 TaxID=765257 RepID=A0A0C9XQE0_9AGAM|nr:hypothetical protein PISMIDRAFT_687966 [Pisolithus microcarpus 441]